MLGIPSTVIFIGVAACFITWRYLNYRKFVEEIRLAKQQLMEPPDEFKSRFLRFLDAACEYYKQRVDIRSSDLEKPLNSVDRDSAASARYAFGVVQAQHQVATDVRQELLGKDNGLRYTLEEEGLIEKEAAVDQLKVSSV